MSEFTNGTVARRRISRVAEMLFGGDESLIPVLDYSSSYLSRPIILPPPMFPVHCNGKWRETPATVAGHNWLCTHRGVALIGDSWGGYLHRCRKEHPVRPKMLKGEQGHVNKCMLYLSQEPEDACYCKTSQHASSLSGFIYKERKLPCCSVAV